MTMGAKTGAGLHPIFVDHAQGTEFDVLRVVIIGKGKCMKGLEPAVVGKSAFLTASNFVHGNLLGLHNMLEHAYYKVQKFDGRTPPTGGDAAARLPGKTIAIKVRTSWLGGDKKCR